MAEIYRLRFYEDDGSTVAAEYSTDPVHSHPYLIVPEQLAGQDIDFANGRAKIGGCVVEIVDVPTTPSDQDTGHVTSILADGSGRSARIGRRAHLEVLIGASYENVVNGVVDDIALHESFSSYVVSIKDQRENERRTLAFTNATTSAIIPRGVIDGFGYNAASDTWLAPPVEPLVAEYSESTYTGGFFDGAVLGLLAFEQPPKDKDGRWNPPANQVVTDRMLEQFRQGSTDSFAYDRIRILWRGVGGSTWNVIEQPLRMYAQPFTPQSGIYSDNGRQIECKWLGNFFFFWPAGSTRPTDGQSIEVIFGYNGPPTKDYPLHIETTFGELLKGMLDGDYADGAPATQYDEDAVLALGEVCRARITEPLDDEDGIWKWVEQNIYAPLESAPALDTQGLISPVRYRLPDESEVLPQLDDTNCEAIPGWNHSGSDAINMVSVEYSRLYAVPADLDPLGQLGAGDGIAERKITVTHKNVESIAFLGEKPLKIKAVTLSALAGTEGDPITGDVTDEFGAQVALRISRSATDRFLLGGQHFAVRAMRSALSGTRVGGWAIVACSWMPEYSTGTRGANRLAQIVSMRSLDTQWVEVELVDAGPENTPVGQPTLNEASFAGSSDGTVTGDVTAIATGSEARVDYAVSDTMPANDSGLWRMFARIAAPGSVSTPPAPADGTIWIRARGEKEGRRPSAWTIPFSVDVPATPRVRKVRVTIDRLGVPTVTYEPNTLTNGVRITYSLHLPRVEPTMGSATDYAATGSHELTGVTVKPGQVITVDVEAWSGFTTGAVSGTQGETVRARQERRVDENALALSRFRIRKRSKETVTIGGVPGALVDAVIVFDKLYAEPEDEEEIETPEILETDIPADIIDASDTDASGFITYVCEYAPANHKRYLWFIPIDSEGTEGRIERLIVDAKPGTAPYFDRIRQSNSSLLLSDVFGRVVDPDLQGGTLMVWSPDADFSGDPSGTIEVEATPFSFGPSTEFSTGQLLNDLTLLPGVTRHIALQFDTTDGRTTGQVLITLEDSLEDLVDELGQLRVESLRNALALATDLAKVGVGPGFPPDGDEYQWWYNTSDASPLLWHWNGSGWELAAVDGGALVANSITAGAIQAGAIGAEAIAAGVITAIHIGSGAITADKLNIGGLSFVGDDLGAITSGVITGAGGLTIDLDATGSEVVLSHTGFALYANGNAVFSGAIEYGISSMIFGDTGSITIMAGLGILTISGPGSGGEMNFSGLFSAGAIGCDFLAVGGLDVGVGAADSGGTGFRALVVPN